MRLIDNARARIRTVHTVLILGVFLIPAAAIIAQTAPQWNIVKPSTTGIPGEEVRVMRMDPEGNLWVAGRWRFWGESGIAMLSADQLPYEPIPGGGFDTDKWKVWSSVHHPIPSPYIHDMQFGADGTIWIASDGGLTRFRRNAQTPAEMWHTYDTVNSPLLIDPVRSIAIDNQGNVWVSNAEPNFSAGLFKLNPATNQWTQMPIQSGGGSPPPKPWIVSIGNNGHILVSFWIVAGFGEYNGSSWTIRSDGPPEIDSLAQDTQGNIWAATGRDGLWRWNGTSWRSWPILGGTFTITGLGRDQHGVIYVSCWYGPVYKMINDEPVFFADAGSLPRSVMATPGGDIWTSNYGGTAGIGTVRHYTAGGQLLERLTTTNTGLPDYFVDRIISDSAGNMWFATGEAGLSRMLGSDGASTAATQWRNFGAHNFGSEPYPWAGNEPMYALMEDADGIFWMAGNGVGRWNSNTGQFISFWNSQNSNIDSSGVMDIVKRANIVWIGTGGSGVSWLNGNVWTRVYLSTGGYHFASNNVKAMTVDTQGNLWVASEYGLRKFAAGNNSTFAVYLHDNSPLPSNGVLDVEADPAGGIWIGTYAGLARFDGTNWTIYNQANTGMPGVVISDIARRDSDGLIAIANNQGSTFPYTGGVSTFDGQTWTHYTTENSPLTHWQVTAVEFDRNGNLWASPMSEGVVQIMIGSGSRRAPFDFDGDGKTDVSIFRPSVGQWWLHLSSDGGSAAVQFGSSTDKLIPADYTGDGKADLAFFRPSSGEWFVLRSEDNSFFSFRFGIAEDIPHPTDYDGDGRADPAVFRPSTGVWYISRSTGGTTIQQFGLNGDSPVAADYDGDGKADLAIYRHMAGEWWIQRSTGGTFAVAFGNASDRTVAGDHTGDGKADIAIWRPSTGEWYVLRSEDSSYYSIPFGTSGDSPSPGDYDGDGKIDPAVFRPSTGTWYINRSSSATLIQQFGTAGDAAVPSSLVR